MKPLDRPEMLMAKAAEDEALVAASVDNPAISDAIVGFHLQQAAEKLLKALLARRGVAYRRTHDLFELFGLLSASGLPLSNRLLRIGLYTPYAVEFRYDEPDLEAKLDRPAALALLRELRQWAETKMPPSPPDNLASTT